MVGLALPGTGPEGASQQNGGETHGGRDYWNKIIYLSIGLYFFLFLVERTNL